MQQKPKIETGFTSILYSIGAKPLQLWDMGVKNGHIKRLIDNDIQSSVIELVGANINHNYIARPIEPTATLNIKMPTIVLLVKHLRKYFSFEVLILDDKNIKRRFRASNFQSNTRVKPFLCTIPMKLEDGWNQVHIDLDDFTRRAFNTNYVETLRVQVHANCRLRRIYFTDLPLTSKKIPPEYKAFAAVEEDGSLEKIFGMPQNVVYEDINGEK